MTTSKPFARSSASPTPSRALSTRRKAVYSAAIASLLAVTPGNLFAWGDAGHRMIGLAAAQKLPAEMPAFFRKASEQLSYLNPEPDRWKDRAETTLDPALNGGSSPEHYMDMDMVSPLELTAALAAPNRFAFADTLRKAGAPVATVGLLPFMMLELAQRLRGDFRQWRIAPDSTIRAFIEQRIIDDAGILGHYVADGSNPHHTTKHHNGWVGENPKRFATDNRFHGRFESAYVQGQIKLPDILDEMNAAPKLFPNLRTAIIEYLNTSFSQLDRLYEIDKATPFQAETSTAEQKAFASARLAAGAAMLRDIWWTAWVTSGQPVVIPPRSPRSLPQ